MITDVPGHARDAPALGQEVRRAHHHLGGDAPPIGALAADQLCLDADDLETRVRQVPRHLLTPGSEADDDRIDLHGSYSPPQFVTLTGATIGRTDVELDLVVVTEREVARVAGVDGRLLAG